VLKPSVKSRIIAFHKGIEQKPFRVQSGAAFVHQEPTSVPESGTPYAQYALCKARCCQSGYTFELVTGQIFALPNQAPACRALRNIYLWRGGCGGRGGAGRANGVAGRVLSP